MRDKLSCHETSPRVCRARELTAVCHVAESDPKCSGTLRGDGMTCRAYMLVGPAVCLMFYVAIRFQRGVSGSDPPIVWNLGQTQLELSRNTRMKRVCADVTTALRASAPPRALVLLLVVLVLLCCHPASVQLLRFASSFPQVSPPSYS